MLIYVRRSIKSWGTACSTGTSCPLMAYSLAEGTDYKPLTPPKIGKVRGAKCLGGPASLSGKTIVMVPLPGGSRKTWLEEIS